MSGKERVCHSPGQVVEKLQEAYLTCEPLSERIASSRRRSAHNLQQRVQHILRLQRPRTTVPCQTKRFSGPFSFNGLQRPRTTVPIVFIIFCQHCNHKHILPESPDFAFSPVQKSARRPGNLTVSAIMSRLCELA